LSIKLFSTSDNLLPPVEPNNFNCRECLGHLGVGKIQGCCEFVLELEFSDCKLKLVEKYKIPNIYYEK